MLNTTPAVTVLKTDHMGQNGQNHSVEVAPTLDVASAAPVICMADATSNAAIDEDCCGTLLAARCNNAFICLEPSDG
ncbi:MAG: hypothetical protein J6S36_03890 [Eggerthellaceae bacterium]|nr:hypothetical protein [Eggerthellaceae bacterium]